MNIPVQVPCEHGRRVHDHFMLECAEFIALGNADPRLCLTCQSEWPLGRRPLHPAEFAREIPGFEDEEDGRWSRTYDAQRFATRVVRASLQLDQTEDQSTCVYNTFKDMLRAQGQWETASFLLCTLFCYIFLYLRSTLRGLY